MSSSRKIIETKVSTVDERIEATNGYAKQWVYSNSPKEKREAENNILKLMDKTIKKWVSRFHLPKEEAEDLEQEYRIGMIKTLGGYNPPVGDFENYAYWAFVRARQDFFKKYNKNRLNTSLNDHLFEDGDKVERIDLLESEGDNVDSVEDIISTSRIKNLIDHREAFILDSVYHKNLSFYQLSSMMKTVEWNVRKIHNKAIEKIEKLIKSDIEKFF